MTVIRTSSLQSVIRHYQPALPLAQISILLLKTYSILSFVAANYRIPGGRMSCMRYLTRSRASLVTRRYLNQPSIAHIHQSDDADAKAQLNSSFLPQTPFRNSSKTGLFRSVPKYSDFPVPPRFGASFRRFISTENGGSGHSDVADPLSENAVQDVASSAPAAVVSDVSFDASGFFFPMSVAQNFIDGVHSYTGFNWWSSIIIATLIYKGVIELPDKLYHYYDRSLPAAPRDNANITIKTLIENMTAIWLSVGIYYMAKTVPSFKTGGAFWFIDLSTPDSLFIFPLLTALTCCYRFEVFKKANNLNKILVPLILFSCLSFFPKAILLHWVTYVLYDKTFAILEKSWSKK